MTLLDHTSAFAGQRVETLPLREARAAFERAYFEGLLTIHGGNVCAVWAHSGMGDRSAVYRKLRSVGIDAERVREIRDTAKGREAG